jgi:hypothetical protein
MKQVHRDCIPAAELREILANMATAIFHTRDFTQQEFVLVVVEGRALIVDLQGNPPGHPLRSPQACPALLALLKPQAFLRLMRAESGAGPIILVRLSVLGCEDKTTCWMVNPIGTPDWQADPGVCQVEHERARPIECFDPSLVAALRKQVQGAQSDLEAAGAQAARSVH